MNFNGWKVTTGGDSGQYLYIERDGAPGTIHIKADDEGFVLDVWTADTTPEIAASTCVEYTHLEPE